MVEARFLMRDVRVHRHLVKRQIVIDEQPDALVYDELSFSQNDLAMRWLRNGSLGAHEYQRTEIEVHADAAA